MKKTLLLQTALVATVGVATADIAAAQVKAEPLAVSVGGYFSEIIKFHDGEDGTTVGNRHSTAISQDAEIYFNIRGVLDNGVVVGGRVELEAATDADQIDERYLFVERSDIGRAEIGSTDRAANKMVYGAPVAIPGYGTIDPTGSVAVTNVPTGARTGGALTKFSGIDDREGINLYTPSNRFFGSKAGKGLQLGASYTPDGCEDFSGCGGGFGSTNNAGQFSKVYTVAANYLESFGSVDVALFGAYNRFSIEANGTSGDATVYEQSGLQGYVAGTTLTFNLGAGSSLQVGGAYKFEETGSNNPTTGLGGDDRTLYTAGVRYLTNGSNPGSVGIGVDYALTKTDQGNVGGVVAAGEDEYTWYSAGLTYQVARGVLAFGGLGYYEYEDAVAATAAANNNYDATFGVVGMRLDF